MGKKFIIINFCHILRLLCTTLHPFFTLFYAISSSFALASEDNQRLPFVFLISSHTRSMGKPITLKYDPTIFVTPT